MTVVSNSAVEDVDTTKGAAEAAQAGGASGEKAAAPAKEGVFDDLDKPTQAPVGEDAGDVEERSRLPGAPAGLVDEKVKINKASYTSDDLKISPDEKAAFIDAMITGERYKQTFRLFGGRVTVTLRSRTAAETHAMYAYIRHVLSKNGPENMSAVEGDMAYVPLVAQVAELNGTAFPEMKEPLMFTESDGKEVAPGWYGDFKAWKAKPEGLTSALISCVQLFEYKYWTMTREAANKNFWSSDTSIAE